MAMRICFKAAQAVVSWAATLLLVVLLSIIVIKRLLANQTCQFCSLSFAFCWALSIVFKQQKMFVTSVCERSATAIAPKLKLVRFYVYPKSKLVTSRHSIIRLYYVNYYLFISRLLGSAELMFIVKCFRKIHKVQHFDVFIIF